MPVMHRFIFSFVLLVALGCVSAAPAAGKAEHVVVVVWDGMRPDFISAEHTPTLWRLAHEGVMFQNHHSVYVSATDVNGTAIATGAYPEHSGVIANVDFRPELNPLKPFPVPDRTALTKGDELSGGNYLARPTVAEILRAAGRQTVIAGTKDVVLLHDRRARADNSPSLNLFAGESLPATVAASAKNSLGAFPDNADLQSTAPNTARDEWTRRAFTDVLWSNGVPAYSLLWLSEPDFSQHAAGPGSPKALAALESSDRQLAAVLAELVRRKLREKTDVFVVSDHGFSTIESTLDVCAVVRQAGLHAVREFKAPPQKGDVLVIGQGGSVLFYVIGHEPEVTRLLVEYLQQQDFTGVVLTRAGLKGTFPLADAKINSANPPDVVVSLRWTDKKSGNGTPGMFVSDGGRKPGAGNHASLSRFDLHNTLVGAGPDLKTNFSDTLPTGNVDLAPTILWLLGVPQKTPMDGRVLSEALNVSAPKVSKPSTRRLEVSRKLESAVWHQYLQVSRVNDTVYLDEGNGSQTPQ
jgi:arylsulfatase A-like enzyme